MGGRLTKPEWWEVGGPQRATHPELGLQIGPIIRLSCGAGKLYPSLLQWRIFEVNFALVSTEIQQPFHDNTNSRHVL